MFVARTPVRARPLPDPQAGAQAMGIPGQPMGSYAHMQQVPQGYHGALQHHGGAHPDAHVYQQQHVQQQQPQPMQQPRQDASYGAGLADLRAGLNPEQHQQKISKAEAYKRDLQEQIDAKKQTKLAEKQKQWAYENKVAAAAENYNPWGRGGAGAPHRDASGNIITNLKTVVQAKEQQTALVHGHDQGLNPGLKHPNPNLNPSSQWQSHQQPYPSQQPQMPSGSIPVSASYQQSLPQSYDAPADPIAAMQVQVPRHVGGAGPMPNHGLHGAASGPNYGVSGMQGVPLQSAAQQEPLPAHVSSAVGMDADSSNHSLFRFSNLPQHQQQQMQAEAQKRKAQQDALRDQIEEARRKKQDKQLEEQRAEAAYLAKLERERQELRVKYDSELRQEGKLGDPNDADGSRKKVTRDGPPPPTQNVDSYKAELKSHMEEAKRRKDAERRRQEELDRRDDERVRQQREQMAQMYNTRESGANEKEQRVARTPPRAAAPRPLSPRIAQTNPVVHSPAAAPPPAYDFAAGRHVALNKENIGVEGGMKVGGVRDSRDSVGFGTSRGGAGVPPVDVPGTNSTRHSSHAPALAVPIDDLEHVGIQYGELQDRALIAREEQLPVLPESPNKPTQAAKPSRVSFKPPNGRHSVVHDAAEESEPVDERPRAAQIKFNVPKLATAGRASRRRAAVEEPAVKEPQKTKFGRRVGQAVVPKSKLPFTVNLEKQKKGRAREPLKAKGVPSPIRAEIHSVGESVNTMREETQDLLRSLEGESIFLRVDASLSSMFESDRPPTAMRVSPRQLSSAVPPSGIPPPGMLANRQSRTSPGSTRRGADDIHYRGAVLSPKSEAMAGQLRNMQFPLKKGGDRDRLDDFLMDFLHKSK